MKKVFALFIFSALVMNSLAACGDTGKQTADESTESLVENVSESTEKPKSTRREADFDNYVFRIITRDDTNTTWRVIDVVDSEENIGDSINDAVYKRNMAVSEEYNITFERIVTIHEQIVATVSKLVLAGDDTFDALQTILTHQSQLSSEGYLHNLDKFDDLKLAEPWWDSIGNDFLRIGGALYSAMGDINIIDNDATYAVLFNKHLIANYPVIPDIYQLVRDGKWTLDKLHEYAQLVSKDLDGNSVMEWDKDQFGVIDQYEVSEALLLGSGMRAVEFDKDGYLEYNLNNEKISDTFEKVYELFSDDTCQITTDAAKYSSVADKWNVISRGTFKSDRGLFYIGPTVNVRLMRDMTSDFGIIPIPKIEESQETYHSMLQSNNATSYSIPISVSDPDRSALILEALAEESVDTLTPAYYENTLKRKASRDSESADMLDLIFANRIIDQADTYATIGIKSFIEGQAAAKSNTFASSEASKRASFIEKIDKVNEAFRKLKDN